MATSYHVMGLVVGTWAVPARQTQCLGRSGPLPCQAMSANLNNVFIDSVLFRPNQFGLLEPNNTLISECFSLFFRFLVSICVLSPWFRYNGRGGASSSQ